MPLQKVLPEQQNCEQRHAHHTPRQMGRDLLPEQREFPNNSKSNNRSI
jgi:hypothetical protein